jgi:hypothetical protein
MQFLENLDPEQTEQVKRLLEELDAWCRQAVPLIERKLGAGGSP